MKSGIPAIALAVAVGLVSNPTAGAVDPSVIKTFVADVTGQVVQVESARITIRVPQTVQTGVTRRRIGSGPHARTVTVPKYGVKYTESTHPLASDVAVKTIAGKSAALSDVRPGSPVQLRVTRVTERVAGEKSQTRIEVSRVLISVPPK